MHYNETIGKFSVSRDEDYHDHYFKEFDILCQRFLTPAFFKLQRHEMNQSMHYRYYNANLENELKQKVKYPNKSFVFGLTYQIKHIIVVYC